MMFDCLLFDGYHIISLFNNCLLFDIYCLMFDMMFDMNGWDDVLLLKKAITCRAN